MIAEVKNFEGTCHRCGTQLSNVGYEELELSPIRHWMVCPECKGKIGMKITDSMGDLEITLALIVIFGLCSLIGAIIYLGFFAGC